MNQCCHFNHHQVPLRLLWFCMYVCIEVFNHLREILRTVPSRNERSLNGKRQKSLSNRYRSRIFNMPIHGPKPPCCIFWSPPTTRKNNKELLILILPAPPQGTTDKISNELSTEHLTPWTRAGTNLKYQNRDIYCVHTFESFFNLLRGLSSSSSLEEESS